MQAGVEQAPAISHVCRVLKWVHPGANKPMEVPQAFHRAAVGCRCQIIAEISFSALTARFDTGTLPLMPWGPCGRTRYGGCTLCPNLYKKSCGKCLSVTRMRHTQNSTVHQPQTRWDGGTQTHDRDAKTRPAWPRSQRPPHQGGSLHIRCSVIAGLDMATSQACQPKNDIFHGH